MYTQAEIGTIIGRIKKMEYYFDTILSALENTDELLDCKSEASQMLKELIDYYENGQWMRDYECDEMGILPENLKRGVLSEDGIYNLLAEIEELDCI